MLLFIIINHTNNTSSNKGNYIKSKLYFPPNSVVLFDSYSPVNTVSYTCAQR
jgi:hypothetical protein